MNDVTLLIPGPNLGGTNLLLGRVAITMAREHGLRIQVIDLERGPLVSYLKSRGVEATLLPYHPGQPNSYPPSDLFLAPLLTGKLIGKTFILPEESRLLLWSTHPFDGYKYLPTSNLMLRRGEVAQMAGAWGLHPWQATRVRNMLVDAAERGGLAFMDDENRRWNSSVFRADISRRILPICTESPRSVPEYLGGATRVAWLGRLSDFKVAPLCGLIRALAGDPQRRTTLLVIGDGVGRASVERCARQCSSLPVTFVGMAPPHDLDRYLLEHVDLLVGHGTSILESAKLGIPSLLIDGFYGDLSGSALRVEWLHLCEPLYLGKIAETPSDLVGTSLSEKLCSWREGPKEIGAACKEHWRRNHAPAEITANLLDMVSLGDYTVRDFIRSGANRWEFHGKLIESLKRFLTKSIN